MSDWQIIDTAPRDGREVFLWVPIESGPMEGSTKASLCIVVASWSDALRDWNSDFIGEEEPTHWMPLPPPPAENQQ